MSMVESRVAKKPRTEDALHLRSKGNGMLKMDAFAFQSSGTDAIVTGVTPQATTSVNSASAAMHFETHQQQQKSTVTVSVDAVIEQQQLSASPQTATTCHSVEASPVPLPPPAPSPPPLAASSASLLDQEPASAVKRKLFQPTLTSFFTKKKA